MKVVILLVLLYAVFLVDCDQNEEKPRIVKGVKVQRKDFPFQAGYFVPNKQRTLKFHCGASILDKNTILTAGHCIRPNSLGHGAIRVGSKKRDGGQLVEVDEAIVHPEYKELLTDYDYAILKLAEDVEFSENIQPAKLPKPESVVPVGSKLVIAGWGDTKEDGRLSDVLLGASLRIVDRKTCQKSYPIHNLTDIHICAIGAKGGEDSCQADSGGPVVHNGVLVGVTSFGDGCGRPGIPGVYANVAKVVPWILSNLG